MDACMAAALRSRIELFAEMSMSSICTAPVISDGPSRASHTKRRQHAIERIQREIAGRHESTVEMGVPGACS
jgi:hypothetical protein